MEIEKLIKHMREEAQDYRSGRTLGRAFADAEDVLDEAATALSTLQAENEKLRAELEQVTAERDAAIKELDEVTSEVDDLAEFVDREIHPVVDYNLYLDLRENVDAVSMFQHEDEWRGLHKEE